MPDEAPITIALFIKKVKIPSDSYHPGFLIDSLCERILGGVVVTLREVVVDLVNGDAHVLQHLPQVLALVAEHNGAVVWVVLLDEDMTIEAAHVLDTEDTDRTE
jgi:hypothetical protein